MQVQHRYLSSVHGSGHSGHFTDTIWRQFVMSPAKSYVLFSFIVVLFLGALVSTRLLDSAALDGGANRVVTDRKSLTFDPRITKKPRNKVEYPLNCTAAGSHTHTKSCPGTYPTSYAYAPEEDNDATSPSTCPEYFRWIHEDLRPWARTGITREMVERARKTANFRLVIVKGKAYVETYTKAFQSRDTFTLWGILQLLRRYPGRIPDLDLMFDCVDWPVVLRNAYCAPDAPAPPPLFRYCANDQTYDIVFPDWSFWGWPEVNIKSWEPQLKDLEEGNRRIKWSDREPYAYWKGNPTVAPTRQDLMKCNVSEGQEWNARVFAQDWIKEQQEGYKQSDLASQCRDRFKIYIEGSAWSVSEKYILACDSVTLIVTPKYYDFYTRGLMPLHHYWPINDHDKCRSIKFAVDWGNSHKKKAKAMGRAASKFIQDELKLDYVYDYMFHLLNQYSKLLRYQPTVPPEAVEYCAERLACAEEGPARKFMEESLVQSPKETSPCTLPPSYDPSSLNDVLQKKENSILQVESWQRAYWENQTKQS